MVSLSRESGSGGLKSRASRWMTCRNWTFHLIGLKIPSMRKSYLVYEILEAGDFARHSLPLIKSDVRFRARNRTLGDALSSARSVAFRVR